jgi:two-component system sensor histidine kinase KdpD
MIMMGLSQVALVDELAHTNVPGSGHNEKRWQDVMEILFEGSGRKDAEQLVRLRQLTSDVGAHWNEVQDEDPAHALCEFARSHQITQTVVGSTSSPGVTNPQPHRRTAT